MKIFKYRAVVRDEGSVVMPIGAKILTVQIQVDTPYFWALVDPGAGLEDHKYSVRGTGHPADGLGAYIGTIQTDGGLVFHYFEGKA